MSKFPTQPRHFFIEGPAGCLEAVAYSGAHPSSRPITVVILHPHPLYGGTMENKVVHTVFKACLTLGFSALKFNFRGVGKSEGSFDEGRGEGEDAKAVIEWVRDFNKGGSIALAGFSFGSYVATRLAAQGEFEFLVTIAPPVSHFDFSSGGFPRCPWWVIQGEDDEVVSPSAVFRWFTLLPSNAKLVRCKGVGHFFHKKLGELQKILIREMGGLCPPSP
ncbi:MAG: alpha/beta fold hydrolase [Gammaproteobacteria bacterium]|nr:alpha/beta fold hydrolase [Gammaproteobacteria bacterium]